jgi:hypothetical protein
VRQRQQASAGVGRSSVSRSSRLPKRASRTAHADGFACGSMSRATQRNLHGSSMQRAAYLVCPQWHQHRQSSRLSRQRAA